MLFKSKAEFRSAVESVLSIEGDEVHINDQERFRAHSIDQLVYNAVLNPEEEWRTFLQWLIRESAAAMEVHPASLYSFYDGMGRGTIGPMTVPAFNLRLLTYDFARACFRAAKAHNAGPIIFQITPTELSYTGQTLGELAACVFGAAVREFHVGPVFLQVDRLSVDEAWLRETERAGLEDLLDEAVNAGYFNFNLEATRLFDRTRPTEAEQARATIDACASAAAHLRGLQPAGVTIAIGCELPRVPERNGTATLARVFADEFLPALRKFNGEYAGFSKLSIGTTVEAEYPPENPSPADEFRIVDEVGQLLRRDFQTAGAAMHDVSSLPNDLFARLRESGVCEAHFASEFQNLALDHGQFPVELKSEMYAWLDRTSRERNAPKHEDRFYIENRKYALGEFKQRLWDLPLTTRTALAQTIAADATSIIDQFGLTNSERELLDNLRIQRVAPPAPAQGLHPSAETRFEDLVTPRHQTPTQGDNRAF